MKAVVQYFIVGVIPKEGLAGALFGYDNDKDLKVCFLVTCLNISLTFQSYNPERHKSS